MLTYGRFELTHSNPWTLAVSSISMPIGYACYAIRNTSYSGHLASFLGDQLVLERVSKDLNPAFWLTVQLGRPSRTTERLGFRYNIESLSDDT